MKITYKITLVTFAVFFIACSSGNDENRFTGIIEGTVVKVPALSGGQIIELSVDIGDKISENQKLAIVDSTELVLQKQQLKAMISELLVQTDIARTNLKRNNDDLVYVKTKYDRIANLYKANSVPEQNYDDIKNQLDRVNTALITSRQQLQSISAKTDQIQAQIDLLNKKIRDTIIKAPVSGVITAKYYEQGEAIPPMKPVLELTNLNQVETRIYVSEKMLPRLSYGKEVGIHVDGIDDTLPGKITWISPKSEFTPKNILTPETRTTLVYALRVTIENDEGYLKHGMPIIVEIQDL